MTRLLKIHSITKILFCSSLLTLIFLVFVKSAQADNLKSTSYEIQFGNFNMTAGEKNSASYKVTDTVGQTGAGPFGAYGSSTYFVGGGFQYIYQIKNFRFTISNLSINLGDIPIAQHVTASHTISINTRGAGGYTVYAYELHPLKEFSTGTFLPDTTCDAADCTEIVAKAWTNQSIPGFGFSMSGNDVPADFTGGKFRQFANAATSESMQSVMSSTSIALDRTATVTYKAGASASQTAGNYQTGIVFVAVPGY